jgi:uncharacterized protein YndB with AHSA1/START domain
MTVGKTKDAGWQIGVSRTVAHPVDDVWELLTSAAGIALWLGAGVTFEFEKGEHYTTDAGVSGEVRSYHPADRIRITWQPPDWDHNTTVQIAVQAKGPKTTIRFHQERLANSAERQAQREHWKGVADRIQAALDA